MGERVHSDVGILWRKDLPALLLSNGVMNFHGTKYILLYFFNNILDTPLLSTYTKGVINLAVWRGLLKGVFSNIVWGLVKASVYTGCDTHLYQRRVP